MHLLCLRRSTDWGRGGASVTGCEGAGSALRDAAGGPVRSSAP